jgi:ABC-type glycerol-3-phosphate transport system substrate-binding protein
VLAGAVFALGVGASGARPARSDQVTISMVSIQSVKPAYDVLIPNFERRYPNITVDPTYPGNYNTLYQLEPIELAAGNAPDLLTTSPGCGTPIALCVLVPAGDLAPMAERPGRRR